MPNPAKTIDEEHSQPYSTSYLLVVSDKITRITTPKTNINLNIAVPPLCAS
jgi:hypothetical protein